MRNLVLYEDCSRKEVHDVFDPYSPFTPQAGTWGLQCIVKVPERTGDFVFFVTFGKKQADHEFDEGISPDGVLRWQSQPKQGLEDGDIKKLIAHDESQNSIYLFLRTASKNRNILVPYTYLGRLKYIVHDRDRERPVYFTWQILDWDISKLAPERIHLRFEGGVPQVATAGPPLPGLVVVAAPRGRNRRAGVPTSAYAGRPLIDHAEQDAKNRRLGFAGESAVIEIERAFLISSGRSDLVDRLIHVAKIEGDGAGYDIRSVTPEGEEKFIEVKTTRGGPQTGFYVSAHEVRFASEHADKYYLYRVFEFDEKTVSGKVFVQRGDLREYFSLMATQFKAGLQAPADEAPEN